VTNPISFLFLFHVGYSSAHWLLSNTSSFLTWLLYIILYRNSPNTMQNTFAKNPLLVHIPSQINPFHTIIAFQLNFNIILPHVPTCAKWRCLFIFLTKFLKSIFTIFFMFDFPCSISLSLSLSLYIYIYKEPTRCNWTVCLLVKYTIWLNAETTDLGRHYWILHPVS
jgi:hypothetical protein